MTTIAAPTFSQRIAGTLNVLLGNGERGALVLDARSAAGFGHHAMSLSDVQLDFLPIPLLRLLEGEGVPSWHVRVSPAVRQSPDALIRLSALFARFTLEPEFSRETGWKRVVSQERIDDVLSRLDAFSVPPSIVVDGVTEIVALWKLDEPLPLRTASDRDRALDLQRNLSEALGASTALVRHTVPSATGGSPFVDEREAFHPESFIPVCGIVRELTPDAPPLVDIVRFNPELITSVAAIEAALRS